MRAVGAIHDSLAVPAATANAAAGERYPSPLGRALRSPSLVEGEETGVFIVAGQSNCCNHVDTLYAPVSQKVENLNIFDGAIYQAIDPLLGCNATSGNWLGRFADKLIAAGKFARVILVPCGVGATSITQWSVGGNLNDLLAVSFARCAALSLPVSAVLWQQGETDGQNGMAQATYQAALAGLISQQRAMGNLAPWLIGKSTYDGGVSSTAIRSALAAVVDDTTIFAGADTDTLTGSNRQADQTHFTAAGADAAAGLWADAWFATGL